MRHRLWALAFCCAAVLIFQWAGAAQALVAIDPGHGGYDRGIIYDTGGKETSEKRVDLAISKAIAAALRAKGASVFLVRSVDRYLGIAQRARIASARQPAVFLSVHLASANAFQIYASLMPNVQLPPAAPAGGNQAPPAAPAAVNQAPGNLPPAGNQGVQAGPASGGGGQTGPDQQALRQYYLYSMRQRPYLGKSRDLASALEQSLKQAFPGETISYMEIPLPLLDAIAAPAVLVECPAPQYMDYNNPAVVSGMAQAIAGAIISYGTY